MEAAFNWIWCRFTGELSEAVAPAAPRSGPAGRFAQVEDDFVPIALGCTSLAPGRGASQAFALLSLFLASSAALLVLPAVSQAAEASASINPPAETFPSVIVGQRGPQQQFLFTNNGPEEINVEAVSVIGPNANDFSVENDSCLFPTLSSGQSCSLYISFRPSESGLREAQLEILSTAENSPATAALSGRGLTQELTVSPSPLSFPATTVDSNSERQVTVANESEAAITIYGANIEGAGSSSFNTNGSNCGSSLTPGQSCKISIRFSPAAKENSGPSFTSAPKETPVNRSSNCLESHRPLTSASNPKAMNLGCSRSRKAAPRRRCSCETPAKARRRSPLK